MSTHYATQSKAVKISHQNYASIITTLHLSLQYDVDSINYQGNIPLFLPHSSISITLTSEPLQFAAYFSGSHLSPHSYSIKKAKECTPISLSLSSTKLYNAPFSSAEFLSALQLCHNTHEGPDGMYTLPYISSSTYLLILPTENLQQYLDNWKLSLNHLSCLSLNLINFLAYYPDKLFVQIARKNDMPNVAPKSHVTS